jgi:hypothetical protein
MKYRIYIDETGNSDLKASDTPLHRFLSLTGVVVSLDHARGFLYPRLEALKSHFFDHHPDDPVILHRTEMVKKRGAFLALKDPEICKLVDEELLSVLRESEYAVITVCIDKQKHLETYRDWRYDPYHYCLEVMMERYLFCLESVNSVGDVMAESRGGKEDMRLKKVFTELYGKGTDFVKPERFHKKFSSKQLKVKPKGSNVSGLQLADLLAHPSRRDVLVDNGHGEGSTPAFAKKVIDILQGKYYRKGKNLFGKKFL